MKKLLAEAQSAAQQNIERALQEKDFKHEKDVLELQRAHQADLQRIEREKMTEIDEYQKKYLSLLERIQQQEFAHAEKGKKAAKADASHKGNPSKDTKD